jgi:hypothetical protein
MSIIHHAIEIWTDDGSPDHLPYLSLNVGAIGCVAGVLRFITDRPNYDGEGDYWQPDTVTPTYGPDEIDMSGSPLVGNNNNCFFEGFLQKDTFSSLPSFEIDIIKGGDVGTLSGMEFVLTNNASFWKAVRDLVDDLENPVTIEFTGRKVRYWIIVDDVFYSRGIFEIKNNPFEEVDYHFVCESPMSTHIMIPPLIINKLTFPNSENGIESQKITVSDTVTPESNIPANATTQSDTVPICLGDIPYAQLFNVEGSPAFENIAYSSVMNKFSQTTLALAPGNGDVVDPGIADPDHVYHTDSGDFTPGSGWYKPGTLSILTEINTDWEYVLVLAYNQTLSAVYPTDYFKDYFLYKQEDQNGIRIKRSWSTYLSYLANGVYYRCYVIILFLSEEPEDFDVTNMLKSTAEGYSPIDTENRPFINPGTTTFFQISKCLIKQVVSHSPIKSFTRQVVNGIELENGLPVLNIFHNDRKKYESIHGIIEKAVITAGDSTDNVVGGVKFPYLQLKNPLKVQENGIDILTPVIIPKESIKGISYQKLLATDMSTIDPDGSDNSIQLTGAEKLVNRDRTDFFLSNGIELTSSTDRICGFMLTFAIDLSFILDSDLGKVFFGMDFLATTPPSGTSGTSENDLRFAARFRLFDLFGGQVAVDDDDSASIHVPPFELTTDKKIFRNPVDPDVDANNYYVKLTIAEQNGSPPKIVNLLPKNYYVAGGDDNGEDDYFNRASNNPGNDSVSFVEFDSTKMVKLIRNQQTSSILYVDFYFIEKLVNPGNNGVTIGLNLKIKQIGFIAERVISTENKALYSEVAGETVTNDGSTETNTIYTALAHILQDYDGIPQALIDYGNLQSILSYWYCGRQLQERKNSLDYIREICKQSFIGYFISRSGKHSFSSWLNNYSTLIVH